MLKKRIAMENLACNGCTNKINNELKNLKYVSAALFDFNSQIMEITVTNDFNSNESLLEIKKIVDSIESGINTYLLESIKVKGKEYV